MARYCENPLCDRAIPSVAPIYQAFCCATCRKAVWRRSHPNPTPRKRKPMVSHPKGPAPFDRLRDGNFRDVCGDCGTIKVAASENDIAAATCACKRVLLRSEWHVDLVCSLCGALHRTVVVPSSTARLVFTRRIACQRCGGAVWAPDPPEIVHVFANPPIAPLKRGRPTRKAAAA